MYSLNFVPFFRVIFTYIRDYYSKVESFEDTTLNEYILRQLWDNFGIQRKIVGNDVVLLNYNKDHEKYDKNNIICRLSRHLMLDLKNMRIISLGVEKSLPYDSTVNISDVEITKLRHGTMIIYNPSLKEDDRFYISQSNSEENNVNLKEDISSNQNIDPTISTRKKIGTGNYNTVLTFQSYFKYINQLNNLNIDKLGVEKFKNMCFVFNCEHPQEHITNDYRNTLVRCYLMKSTETALESYQTYIKEFDKNKNTEISNEVFEEALNSHATDMVKSIELNNVVNMALESGVGRLNIPHVFKFNSNEELNNFVNNQPNTFVGVTMVDKKQNKRYKINNKGFIEINKLRGDLPLHITPINQENLFKIYYRLYKSVKLHEFLELFDKQYNLFNIFRYFHIEIIKFCKKVYYYYRESNVNKNINKSAIPKHIKILGLEIHGIYLKNNRKIPTTRDIVYEFVMKQDASRIYWRIFEEDRYKFDEPQLNKPNNDKIGETDKYNKPQLDELNNNENNQSINIVETNA